MDNIITRLKMRIDRKSRWTQCAPARDHDGKYVRPTSDDACMWCLTGAILKEIHFSRDPDLFSKICRKLIQHIPEGEPPPVGSAAWRLIKWNDDKKRTYSDIKDLLRRAS